MPDTSATSLENLRQAAALMRKRAEVGSSLNYPPPWRAQPLDIDTHGLAALVTCHEDASGDVTDPLDQDVAEHIASWDPCVAEQVASLLAAVASELEHGDYTVESDIVPTWLHCHIDNVAAAYLRNGDA